MEYALNGISEDKKRLRRLYNTKTLIKKEVYAYFMISIIIGFVVYLLELYFKIDRIICGSSMAVSSFLTFWGIVKVNNRLFFEDKEYIENYVLTNKIDSIRIVTLFHRDITKAALNDGIIYNGNNEPGISELDSVNRLLQVIFHEEYLSVHQVFKNVNGDFIHFLENLRLYQRENLYRYYLNKR